MIARKIKVPSENLIYKYNKDSDILDVYLCKCTSSISEEIIEGVYEHFDRKTDELLGISIEGYNSRNRKELDMIIPFTLNYKYIDNNVCN